MTESDAPTRHGRRARRLTPEEEAAQQALAAATTGDATAAPSVRGAVAPPDADAPVPRLRKFGRRARIIELADPIDATAQSVPDGSSTQPTVEAQPGTATADTGISDVETSGAGTDAAVTASVETSDGAAGPEGPTTSPDVPAPTPGTASTPGTTTSLASTVTVDRDVDGVELGEMSVSEAPDPRPAPRFEGRVLQRSSDTGGRSLLWVVWALIGVALLALIILLATGVLGPGGDAGALGAGSLGATAFLPDAVSLPDPTPLEVTSA